MGRWMYTDAIERVACPKCGQDKLKMCRQPNGRKRDEPHGERLGALGQLPDFNMDDYKIQSFGADRLRKALTNAMS